MLFTPFPSWMHPILDAHLSQKELEQIQSLFHAESWTSPSTLKRDWMKQEDEIPLRFQLQIDMKV